jgi:hypothetical protein
MKRLKDILEAASPKPAKTSSTFSDTMSGIGTAFNQVLNPIRRTLGVKTGELPAGTKEVDYGAALNTFDKAMSGFGGADPGKKKIEAPAPVSTKMQDRVPQEIPRDKVDTAPSKSNSVALQRQMSGDKAPNAPSPQDRLNMMRMQSDKQHDDFKKKMDSDFQVRQNKKLAPASDERAPVSKTDIPAPKPDVASRTTDVTTAPKNQTSTAPQQNKSSVPVPKAKPSDLKTGETKAPKTVKVEKGTTYEKIARSVAKERGTDWRNELKSIMKTNRQKATNLKIGSSIVIPEEYDQKAIDAIKNMKKGKKKC